MNDLQLDVHALADGELSTDECAAVQKALRENPQLQAEYEWAVVIRQTLQTKCAKHGSEECWTAAITQISAIDRSRKTENFVGRYAWAMCGVFVLVIGFAAVSNRFTGNDRLSTNASASLFSGLTPIQRSVSQDEATEAVRQRLGLTPGAMSAIPVAVDEVSYGELDGHRAMKISFRDPAGPLKLLIVEGVTSAEPISQPMEGGMTCGQVGGLNAVSWTESGNLLILAGDRDYGDLARHAAAAVQIVR